MGQRMSFALTHSQTRYSDKLLSFRPAPGTHATILSNFYHGDYAARRAVCPHCTGEHGIMNSKWISVREKNSWVAIC